MKDLQHEIEVSVRRTGSAARSISIAAAGLLMLMVMGPGLLPAKQQNGVGAHQTTVRAAVMEQGDAQFVTVGGAPGQKAYASARLIVKYRDSVTEPVHRLLESGRSFKEATTDGSDSLDRLHGKYHAKSVRPLFRTIESDAALAGADQRTVRRTSQERLETIRQRFAARSARGRQGDPVSDLSHVYLVDIAGDVAAAAAEFSRDPHVEYAQPDYDISAQFVPNDPFYATSGTWGQTYRDLWGLQAIQAEQAWEIAYGAGTVVAVVDSGLDMAHADIQGNVWTNQDEVPGNNGLDDDGNGYVDDVRGWDFANGDADPSDDHGHGTHVSGTIGAVGDNGVGIAGVAFQTRIMPVKGLNSAGSGSSSNLAAALVYAAQNGADVINNSWGCSSACPSNPVVEDAVRLAHDLGAVVVFSAGNKAADVANYSPQNMAETVTVAASTELDNLCSFSNFGVKIDVAAPGGGENLATPTSAHRNILSLKSSISSSSVAPPELIVGTNFLRQAGTSMAAPHVSGAAALVLSAHPAYSNEQVRQALRHGSTDLGAAGFDTTFGYGRLNAAGALLESPLAVLISQPLSYAVLQAVDFMNVSGTAEGPDFADWTLEYGAGASPTSWTSLATSAQPVPGIGLLTSWDVRSLTDGTYTLHLSARKASGEVYEDRKIVTVDNVQLSEPAADTFVRGGETIAITGTAAPADFLSFAIRIQNSLGTWLSNPAVALTGDGQQPVRGGTLGTWDTAGLSADYYTISLEVTCVGGSVVAETRQVVVDPSLHPGWPQNLGAFGNPYRLALLDHLDTADLDGDGASEIIVGYGNTVRVFDHTGALLPGWPQSIDPADSGTTIQRSPAVGDIDGDGSTELVAFTGKQLFAWRVDGTLLAGYPLTRNYLVMSLMIADLQGDGVGEIIVTDWGSRVDVLNANGASSAGWPKVIGSANTKTAAGDVDRDGQKEIVVYGYGYVAALKANGATLPGWPMTSYLTALDATPSMGDLDDDGDLEIVFADDTGAIYAYHHNGAVVTGWPKTTRPGIPANPPSIGDIDGDGRTEVVAGSSSSTGVNYLYAWKGDGTALAGWPFYYSPYANHPTKPTNSGASFFGFGAVSLADVDGDGREDVIVSSDVYSPNFGLQAFNSSHARISGFPKPTADLGAYATNNAAVDDLDGDGLLELAWVDLSFNLYVWDLPSARSSPASWPMYASDAGHTATSHSSVLKVLAKTLQRGTVGSPYDQALEAINGQPPLTWAVTGGALAPGLVLDPSAGRITGTPTLAGTYPFTVQATDSSVPPRAAFRSLSILVDTPLSILTTSLPDGKSGTPYDQTLLASGGASPYTWSLASGFLPYGLSLSADGRISGTPNNTGTYSFTVKATDTAVPARSATKLLSITLAPPFTITATLSGAAVGTPYDKTLAAANGVPPYSWTIFYAYLPPGLTLEAGTGRISGMPTTEGIYYFGVKATDSSVPPLTATRYYSIGVFSIMTTSLSDGSVGVSYSQSLTASYGTPIYTWSVVGGSLPPGLSLSLGRITGTPTAAGTYPCTLQVTDSASPPLAVSRNFTITIALPLTIMTDSLPGGMVEAAYDQTLSAAGGKIPYLWSVAAGSLPGGVSLDPATGRISGTPTAAGTFPFTVQVTDSSTTPQIALKDFTVGVVPALSITTASLPGGAVGVAYDQFLSAANGLVPYWWSVAAGSLPAGLNLDPATGRISGTPGAVGTSAFTVRVTDASIPPQSTTRDYTVAVSLPLSVTTASLPGGIVGVSYDQPLFAANGQAPYWWSIAAGSLPTGLSLDPATGRISGAPSAAGTSAFTVRVTDMTVPPQSATRDFTVIIDPALSIMTTSLPGVVVGISYDQLLSAANGQLPYTWSVAAGSLPAGLTLDPATGRISGTPTAAGTSSFTVRVSDRTLPPQSATRDLTITISAATSLIVLSPNGSEQFPSGSPVVIRWAAPVSMVKFDVSYSLNNGSSWASIASKVPGSLYTWTPLPAANSTACLVKVAGYDSGGRRVIGSDISDRTFSIEVVRLTVPNGGEPALRSGTTFTIAWQHNGTVAKVSKVALAYSLSGYSTGWKTITTIAGDTNPGSYVWQVPAVTGAKTTCAVKVTLLDAKGKALGSDVNDTYFTISP